jgi:hypothetical protein
MLSGNLIIYNRENFNYSRCNYYKVKNPSHAQEIRHSFEHETKSHNSSKLLQESFALLGNIEKFIEDSFINI